MNSSTAFNLLTSAKAQESNAMFTFNSNFASSAVDMSTNTDSAIFGQFPAFQHEMFSSLLHASSRRMATGRDDEICRTKKD